jgi:6-phosphogluconate dehydrogenase (decarboxylating)
MLTLLSLLQVGFIGLGKMGSRMVNHLLDAGTTVVAFDHNRWVGWHTSHHWQQMWQQTWQPPSASAITAVCAPSSVWYYLLLQAGASCLQELAAQRLSHHLAPH